MPGPWRRDFDAARDPYTARNALGITGTGGGGGGFITAVTPPLQVTGTTLSIDLSAYLTTATAAATYQPLDADLTAIAALSGTNVIYYRSAANTWAAVTVGTGLTFTGGTLAATGGGNVSNSGTPTSGQYAKWVTATTIQGVSPSTVLSDIGAAPLASPTFTGDPKAPTPTAGDNDTSIATTAFVTVADNAVKSQLIGSASSGFDTLGEIENYIAANITPALGNKADIFSPTLTGDPKAPTPATSDNDTSIATTAYVKAQGYLTTAAPVGAEYITSTADATLTSERVLTDTATVTWDRTTAGQIKANATGGGGGTATPVPPQGRLTLQTGVPVMVTTQSAKTTIFYTPYVGNQVPIYTGTSMTMTTFAELSVATTDTTKSPAAIGTSKVNDWFVWNDAGTLRIGHGPDWTSDTVRSAGTALVMVNGILLNNASITNGPAAQRGTYVGTTRSNASSQLDWIYGVLTAGGSPGFLGVWNAYNRRQVVSRQQDSTNSVTYNGSGAWGPWLQVTTSRCTWVTGLAEDAYKAIFYGGRPTSAASPCQIGIGLDTITGVASGAVSIVPGGGQGLTTMFAELDGDPVLGVHFVQAMQLSNGGTAIFYGNEGVADRQTTFNFMGWM